jgi:hypothetical protein
MICREKVIVTGNDVGYTQPINGRIVKIFIDYASDAAAATVVTVALEGIGADETVYTKSTSNTDAWVYPYNYADDTGGTNLTYDGTNEIPVPFYVEGRVSCTVSLNTAAKTVTFYIYYERP